MKHKKIIAFLLALLLAVTAIASASCGDSKQDGQKQDEQKNDGAEDSSEAADNADDKTRYNPNFEPVDMGGYVFKFATRDDDAYYHPYPVHTRDLISETETGDLINDAVYRRNTALEEKYNCKFEMDTFLEGSGETQANAIVERSVKAGDKSYDLLMTHMMYGIDSATKGVFYDIAAFPNIDTKKPYWNLGANEGCSIGNRLYMGLSDLSFSTNENLYCIFFNKQLMKDYGVEDPYELVKTDRWTFDKFAELIKSGTADLNGDGKMDDKDRYGYICTAAVQFLWAGGGHMMKKDENDIPVLDLINPKTLDIYDKTYDIMNSENSYSKELWWFTGDTVGMFANSLGVFYGNQLCRVNELRNTEFDFGIVPFPKYESAQERYYAYVDGHASMMSIPLMLPNPEWTGIIIEELSYLSYKDILPVYYDVVLNVKLVRDEESVEMLKILFDSKVFDPAYVMSSGLTGLWVNTIAQQKRDFISAYEKQEASDLRAMQKKIDAILAIE